MLENQDFSQEVGWLLKEKYQGDMTKEAEADIERIKSGEPVAYVIGFVDFLGAKIDLSQKPLIPRSETEFWVEKAIEEIKSGELKEIKCLDIFAGSGCIGVSVLKSIPWASVDFVDLKKTALEQIKINCELNSIDTSRFQIIQSNIFENVTGAYDYIFANPPYIAESSKDEVQGSVLNHEPHKALFGGSDGLSYIKPFLENARKYLKENGKIYMEFGFGQKEELEKMLIEKGFNNTEFYQDQFKKWRYLRIAP